MSTPTQARPGQPETQPRGAARVRSFPAPKQLATVTDLTSQEAQGSVDSMAERVRRVGGTTIRSITHINQLQTIPDDNDDFVPAGEMVRRLMKDNQHIAEMQRAAIEVCDKHRDSVTSNVLQEILDETEKRKWFLFEILQ